jgi:hypothetical protein
MYGQGSELSKISGLMDLTTRMSNVRVELLKRYIAKQFFTHWAMLFRVNNGKILILEFNKPGVLWIIADTWLEAYKLFLREY